MAIDSATFINIQNVHTEEHLPVRLISKKTEIKHVKQSHGIWATWDAYQVEVVLPDLEVLPQRRLEFVNQDVQEALLADLVLLVREARRVLLALKACSLHCLLWLLWLSDLRLLSFNRATLLFAASCLRAASNLRAGQRLCSLAGATFLGSTRLLA